MENTPITKILCPLEKRMDFLPKYTGRHFMKYENMVYGYMNIACTDYDGGLWDFYSLSNGGFFMAFDSDKPLAVEWVDNYFKDTMSAEAASIGVNLFVQNALAWQHPDRAEMLTDHYFQLRDFALEHKEAAKIMRFID